MRMTSSCLAAEGTQGKQLKDQTAALPCNVHAFITPVDKPSMLCNIKKSAVIDWDFRTK